MAHNPPSPHLLQRPPGAKVCFPFPKTRKRRRKKQKASLVAAAADGVVFTLTLQHGDQEPLPARQVRRLSLRAVCCTLCRGGCHACAYASVPACCAGDDPGCHWELCTRLYARLHTCVHTHAYMHTCMNRLPRDKFFKLGDLMWLLPPMMHMTLLVLCPDRLHSLSLSLSLSRCLAVSLSRCLSVCLSVCLSACAYVCVHVCVIECDCVCRCNHVCLCAHPNRQSHGTHTHTNART